MAGDESEVERTLQTTPTWAVATVCFVLIAISIFIDHLLHLLAKYLSKRREKSLIQALEKAKSELMLLGFVSLLLTVCEKPIASICISDALAKTFLPCGKITSDDIEEETTCEDEGKVSMLSREGVRELQHLIFVLAFFHILSCVFTFGLGIAKMKKWEAWEGETKTLDYQFSNDPRRFQLTSQTSFGKKHLKFWSRYCVLDWPACFCRQFYKSVSKPDYLTLRHGFITAHFAESSNFDFQKYIRRALEKDFGVVVGISLWIWIFLVFFIFFHAHAFYNYLWLPFIPFVMLLVVGTKLQRIITKMCLESHGKSHVVRGTLLVRPSDDFFWFGRPALLLHLLHFILFQNSFQLAFFTWTWYKFGFRSCFHQEIEDIVIRFAMGVLVQFLGGYVTLPLYALVTQMGTSMSKAVFTENVVRGLKTWRAAAKKRIALNKVTNLTPPTVSEDATIETAVAPSPSFSTLDASLSLQLERLSGFGGNYVTDEENVGTNQHEKSEKPFDGFVLNDVKIDGL